MNTIVTPPRRTVVDPDLDREVFTVAHDEKPLFDGLFAIELQTLARLGTGTQPWGGMLGAMLPRLVNLGYVKPGMLQLTKKGRAAVDRYTALQPKPQTEGT